MSGTRASSGGSAGGSSTLLDGRYPSSRRVSANAPFSSSVTKCATPEPAAWVVAPPSVSTSTSSPVTVWMTSGPVMNMKLLPRVITTKSVSPGE